MNLDAKSADLTKSVIDSFKSQFVSGEIRPGDFLPSERNLADQLNVSRTTVREAIVALKAMGFVDKRQGRRAQVTKPSLDNCLDILSVLSPQDRDRILNLFELREIIEPACVDLATRRANPADLSAIRQALDQMWSTRQDLAAFAQADLAFHQAVIRATHNEMILMFFKIFDTFFRQHLEHMSRLSNDVESHELVFEAMRDGDAKRAVSQCRKIIIEARNRYLARAADLAGPGSG